ncbi:hypothetical protein H5410_046688 [Solanum commersonii]|uniref:Uncharacterized protein n=1 Tax=Solanum commersonii TaxID=4109 RepID=A0A9J5XGF4_SOLCO|nr:hypothetical protein H5410_046688 [Solanum commersonii]
MEKELQQIKSQQHDAKHAELSPSDDSKIPELEGDDGKHRKTQPNSLSNAVRKRLVPPQQRRKPKQDMSIQI